MEHINEKRTKDHVNCLTKLKKKGPAENSIGFDISSLIQNKMLRLSLKIVDQYLLSLCFMVRNVKGLPSSLHLR